MIAYNVVMMLLITGHVIYLAISFRYIDGHAKLITNINDFSFETILLLNAFLLAYAVIRIRNTIKALRSSFLNENFIRVHLINSFVYAVLYLFLGIVIAILNKDLTDLG